MSRVAADWSSVLVLHEWNSTLVYWLLFPEMVLLPKYTAAVDKVPTSVYA